MARWCKTVKIKHLWMDDETETLEVIAQKAASVSKALQAKLPRFDEFYLFDDVVSNFKDGSYKSYSWAESDFNDALTALYDYADDERIWIE